MFDLHLSRFVEGPGGGRREALRPNGAETLVDGKRPSGRLKLQSIRRIISSFGSFLSGRDAGILVGLGAGGGWDLGWKIIEKPLVVLRLSWAPPGPCWAPLGLAWSLLGRLWAVKSPQEASKTPQDASGTPPGPPKLNIFLACLHMFIHFQGFRPEMGCKMGSKNGVQKWAEEWGQKWGPKMGFNNGVQTWGPNRGSKMGSKMGSLILGGSPKWSLQDSFALTR